MSDKIYNVSKEAAAQLIGVSTRTIDRYISDDKLSSKKVGNKVMLNQSEVLTMRSDYDKSQQSGKVSVMSSETINTLEGSQSDFKKVNIDELADLLDEKFEKFEHALQEKDHLIEDKNKIIFILQNKVGELETKIKSMIALPDYTQEKQELLNEKQKMIHMIEKLEKDKADISRVNRLYIFVVVMIMMLLLVYFLFGDR